MRVALIYPHQLFEEHPALEGAALCVLVEEPLLFSQYRFHAQKLVLHRAAMSAFAARLDRRGVRVRLAGCDALAATGDVAPLLAGLGATEARVVDPCDDWLEARLQAALERAGIRLDRIEDPHALTSRSEFEAFAAERDSLFFTDFYRRQRRRLGLLLDERQRPLGGRWSFDRDNRRKLPPGLEPPAIRWSAPSAEVREAVRWVGDRFPQAPGSPEPFRYPTTPEAARAALEDFLEHRFAEFGPYEDAISAREPFLFHSVLTPALNCGLLSPREVVDAALAHADRVPLASLEGFLRQVVGWREFVRGVYRLHGRRQRTRNFWGHERPMPRALYDGTTGIEPVDEVVRRVLEHGWCHHIERLMVLGNFMLLCEIDPDAVYRWFMELFVDAYDWVMVPNVYGMSQHADGGLMTTKPYLSGSAYLRRMSDFPRGDWCAVWDGLYWRFVDRHRDFFAANPRMAVMAAQLDRMGARRLAEHRRTADRFLDRLHAG